MDMNFGLPFPVGISVYSATIIVQRVAVRIWMKNKKGQLSLFWPFLKGSALGVTLSGVALTGVAMFTSPPSTEPLVASVDADPKIPDAEVPAETEQAVAAAQEEVVKEAQEQVVEEAQEQVVEQVQEQVIEQAQEQTVEEVEAEDVVAVDPTEPEAIEPTVVELDDGTEISIADASALGNNADAPEVSEPSEPSQPSAVDTETASVPAADLNTPEVAAPEEIALAVPETQSDSPVFPTPASRKPEIPLTENDVEIAVDSAVPSSVIVVEDEEPVEEDVADEAPAEENEIVVLVEPEDSGAVIVSEPPDTSSIAQAVEEPANQVIESSDSLAVPALVVPATETSVAGLARPNTSVEENVGGDATNSADAPVLSAQDPTQGSETPVQESSEPVLTTAEVGAVTIPSDRPETVASPQADATEVPEVDTASLPQEQGPKPSPPQVKSIWDRDTDDTVQTTDTRRLPGQSSSGVRILRPRTDTATAPETPTEQEPQVPTDAPTDALTQFAAPFENTGDLPMISVILQDEGEVEATISQLKNVSFPITIVIDPSRADAAERAQGYRDAGFEVATSLALPVQATAFDAAISLEASTANVPQSVAMIDIDGSGSDRDIAPLVIETASDAGRGVVFKPSSGLNSGVRLAQGLNVPSIEVYRDLGETQTTARVVNRFLEQAAFEARRQGDVVLVGNMQQEIIDGLILWSESSRSGQVAMAPLSAVLLSE